MVKAYQADERLVTQQVSKLAKKIKVKSISYGGSTGINDYILKDGKVITCRPEDLQNEYEKLT